MPSPSSANSTDRQSLAAAGKPAETRMTQAAPAASITLPHLSAEVAIPGRGLEVKAGPVELSLPTRYIYYGGLGALAVAGAVELPLAGALAAAGLIVDRMRRPHAAAPESVGSGAAA
ncbi:hypothetical protein [Nocardia sienata]|uniref:hypothetical protein n=1 Tax=Nocardia sienata TaxID=248552 RepID=UPI0007A43358|nr:hypothetical protein [Nocardia sienata]